MTKGIFGTVMTVAAVVAMAAMWWNGWIVGQTRAVAADSPAAASVQTITIYRVTAGDYVIQGGTLVPYGVQPPVPPDDPVVPPVVPTTALAKAIVAEINKIPVSEKRHEQATKLTAVLQLVGTKVGDGTLPHTSAGQALDLLAKAALGNTDSKTWQALLGMLDSGQLGSLLEKAGGAYDTWSPVLNLIESELSKQTAKIGCVSVLETASEAVLSTVPDSGPALEVMRSGKMLGENEELVKLAKAYGFDWTAFMSFLMQLLTLLLPLIISAAKTALFVLIA